MKSKEKQLDKKLSQNKRVEGLIIAHSTRKKGPHRASIFSGHTSEESFRRVTANERLYHGAQVRAQRREEKINESLMSQEVDLAMGR